MKTKALPKAPAKVPFIDLSLQQRSVQKDIDADVRRIFTSQKFVLGEYGRRLEEVFAERTGARHAVACANGSDALYLALAALGVGPGDEVITTPFSFFATAGAISRAGAVPVFADIDGRTFNIDPSKIEARITKKTKAILPVHLFGLAADMEAILRIAKKNMLPVVEDAAQSFGATFRGRQAGAIGDVGCFSFYPTKNLGGAGDGGMLTTSSEDVAAHLRLLRNHGSREKYVHQAVGVNSRLDEIQAVVVLAKMKHIDRWNGLRGKIAARYEKGLAGLPLETPAVPAGSGHVFHLYSILTERRDELHDFLSRRGIGSGVYYPVPLHLQPCYQALGYRRGSLPVSEGVAGRVLSLPMFAEMTAAQVEAVIGAVREFFGK